MKIARRFNGGYRGKMDSSPGGAAGKGGSSSS
jgi:hypothetical protein